jgi:hypothetical protein
MNTDLSPMWSTREIIRKRNVKFITAVLLLAILLNLFVACSGGGSSDGGTSPAGGSLGLGGSDVGFVAFSTSNAIRVINLQTGLSEVLDKYKDMMWPSLDEQEWIAYSTDRRYPDGEDDLLFFDKNLNLLKKTPVSESLRSYPRLSPNRKMVAVMWADESSGEEYNNPKFTVFDRDGKVVFRNGKVTSFEWTPDNKILAAQGKSLFLLEDFNGNATFIQAFANNVIETAIHPDGSKVAVVQDGAMDRESHIYMMNMDGSNLRQLTTSSLNEMNPLWVGTRDLLIVRTSVSTSLNGYNGCPFLFIVNSGAPSILNLSMAVTDNPAFKLIKYQEKDSDSPLRACPYSPPVWFSGK